MKQSLILLVLSILLLVGCDTPLADSTPTSDSSDYSLSSDGKIATVSTSTGLEKMLSEKNVETIELKSGSYNGEYSVNDAKTIKGSPTTSINKISVNAGGAKIDSPKISTLLAGKGIGDGDLTLENVTIENDAIFQGGGAKSIHVLGTSVFNGAVTLDKEGISFKMDALTTITKTLVVLQPANLLPNDINNPPMVSGDVVINYTSTNSGITKFNIKAKNMVIGETVLSMELGENSNIESLVTLAVNLKVENKGIIKYATDTKVFSGDTSEIQVIDITTKPELQAIIALSKMNDSLFPFTNFENIVGDFTLPTKLPISDTVFADLKWTSSNESVISIDLEGKVTIKKPTVTTSVNITVSVTIEEIAKSKVFTLKIPGTTIDYTNLPSTADGTWVIASGPKFSISNSVMTSDNKEQVLSIKYDKITGQVYDTGTTPPSMLTGLVWNSSIFLYNSLPMTKDGTGTISGPYTNLPSTADGTWTIPGGQTFTISYSTMSIDGTTYPIQYESTTGQLYGIMSSIPSKLDGWLWNGSAFTVLGYTCTKGTATGFYTNLPSTADGTWTIPSGGTFSITNSIMTMGGVVSPIQYDTSTGQLYITISDNTGIAKDWFWNGSAFIISGVPCTKGTATVDYINLPSTADGTWTIPSGGTFSITNSIMTMGGVSFQIQYDSSNGQLYTFMTGTSSIMGEWFWNGSSFVVSGSPCIKQ